MSSSKFQFGVPGGSKFGSSGASRGLDAAFGSSSSVVSHSANTTDKAPLASALELSSYANSLTVASGQRSLTSIKGKWIEVNKRLAAESFRQSFPSAGLFATSNTTLVNSMTDIFSEALPNAFDAEIGRCVERLHTTLEREYMPGMRIDADKRAADERAADEAWIEQHGERLRREHVKKFATKWEDEYEEQIRRQIKDRMIRQEGHEIRAQIEADERSKFRAEIEAEERQRAAVLYHGDESPELRQLREQYYQDLYRGVLPQGNPEHVELNMEEMGILDRRIYHSTRQVRDYCRHILSMFRDEDNAHGLQEEAHETENAALGNVDRQNREYSEAPTSEHEDRASKWRIDDHAIESIERDETTMIVRREISDSASPPPPNGNGTRETRSHHSAEQADDLSPPAPATMQSPDYAASPELEDRAELQPSADSPPRAESQPRAESRPLSAADADNDNAPTTEELHEAQIAANLPDYESESEEAVPLPSATSPPPSPTSSKRKRDDGDNVPTKRIKQDGDEAEDSEAAKSNQVVRRSARIRRPRVL